MDSHQLNRELPQFIGTEHYYRHALVRAMVYTDGVRFFAENAGGGAYWFLDIVATEILRLQGRDPFLSITLSVADGRGQIVADDGNGNVLFRKDVRSTDCPPGDWRFYLTDNVLMIPSEY